MIDSFTNEPISVSTDGDAGPYIMVQLDQLDAVKRMLDDAGQPYSVDEDAISLDGGPVTAVIDLGCDADVKDVQRRLDRAEAPHKKRRGGPRNADRG